MIIKILLPALALLPLCLQAQTDTLSGSSEVVVAASKWEQKMNEVPNKITKVSKTDILFNNPQTSADMLAQSGAVFVQKSQLGGGSPMIRGFATNRVLLVVDGVRMNNAIYRSGNLQNVISIDALATETAEVVFGPGSLIYGSDAIGGVMDFHSLEARLQQKSAKKWLSRGSGLVRYSTANQEKTAHADLSLGNQKFRWVGSVTYSRFEDLVMGKNGGQNSYLRPEYVERINNTDSIVPNSNNRRQVFSGYEQWNVLQKLRYKPSEHVDLQYSFYYGGTGTAPRYDRLIEYRNGRLRFAQWDYGPMLWRMHTLKAELTKATALYDEARIILAYQNYEESRIDRQRNNPNRRTQAEKVEVWTLNFDASKAFKKGELYYGAEAVSNLVGSEANSTNINTGAVTPVPTRYPDGSTWRSFGAYAAYKVNLKPKLTLSSGLRYNYATVRSSFDKTFFPFPFDEANLDDGAFTGNLGLVYRPAAGWQINAIAASGFRVPNIDDMGKLFETAPRQVTVPNPNLQSEYAWNFELGVVRQVQGKFRFEITGFHTILDNAIVRRPYSLNGQDSIFYDGSLSQVFALQNVGEATVWGAQALAEVWINKAWSAFVMANYITGKETDDQKNEQVPLRHAPPFYGSAGLRFGNKKLRAEVNAQYNAEVSADEMAPSEQAKVFIYATDEDGKPYSPSWYTVNAKGSYLFHHLMLSVGVENITNQRYRPYSSGIVAPGINFIFSARYSF